VLRLLLWLARCCVWPLPLALARIATHDVYELGVSRCVAPLCRVRRGRHEFGSRGQDGCSSDCVCDCVVPPCLLRRRSLTAAPTLCCAVAAIAAGLTVPAPMPLTTSPPAPTPVPTALLCTTLRCCAWPQDGPASSRAFATGWPCWSMCARRAGQVRASDCLCLAPPCPPSRPS
jgi:hypothetical protein